MKHNELPPLLTSNNECQDACLSSCLFRYRSVNNNTISALREDKVFFSSPISFNDPYDCLPFADFRKIAGEVHHNLIDGMDRYLEKIKPIIPEAAFLTYGNWNKRKDEMINEHLERIHSELVKILYIKPLFSAEEHSDGFFQQ